MVSRIEDTRRSHRFLKRFGNLKKTTLFVPVIIILSVIVFTGDLLTPLGIIIWIFYLVPFLLICIHFSEKTSYSSILFYCILIAIGLVASPPGVPVKFAVFNRVAGIILLVLIAFLVNWLKRSQREIRNIKERYDLAISMSQTGLWDFSVTDNKIIWNENMYKIYGISANEFDGTLESWLKKIHPEDLDRVKSLIEKVFAELDEFEETCCIIRGDGEKRYIKNFGKVSRNENGKPVRIAGINIDDTIQKCNEIRLRELNSKLSLSNSELENFAYIASHDLQEPLRMITSFSTLLEKRYSGKLDQEAHEFIQFIVDGTRQMQALINDLLTYSRVTTQPGPRCETDVTTILKRVLENLQVKIESSKAIIRVGEMPIISGNETQLVRLFQNLIDNAIKFTINRVPEISVNCRSEKRYWVFSISDNGIGIEDKYKEKIFQIFQRLHTREKFPGTGIGLAICKKIVELHNGKIWFESDPGIGTTFHFTLTKQD